MEWRDVISSRHVVSEIESKRRDSKGVKNQRSSKHLSQILPRDQPEDLVPNKRSALRANKGNPPRLSSGNVMFFNFSLHQIPSKEKAIFLLSGGVACAASQPPLSPLPAASAPLDTNARRRRTKHSGRAKISNIIV